MLFPNPKLAIAHQSPETIDIIWNATSSHVLRLATPTLLASLLADQPGATAPTFDVYGPVTARVALGLGGGRVTALVRSLDVVVERVDRVHDDRSGVIVAAGKPRVFGENRTKKSGPKPAF